MYAAVVVYLFFVVPYFVVFTNPSLLWRGGVLDVMVFLVDFLVELFFLVDLYLNIRMFAFVDSSLTGSSIPVTQVLVSSHPRLYILSLSVFLTLRLLCLARQNPPTLPQPWVL